MACRHGNRPLADGISRRDVILSTASSRAELVARNADVRSRRVKFRGRMSTIL